MDNVIGRPPESLTLKESLALAGKFIALEIYSPATTPLRVIAAIGEEPEHCVADLAARGADPRRYEITRLKPPF